MTSMKTCDYKSKNSHRLFFLRDNDINEIRPQVKFTDWRYDGKGIYRWRENRSNCKQSMDWKEAI